MGATGTNMLAGLAVNPGPLFAADDGGALGGLIAMAGTCFVVFGILFLLIFVIMWKVFAKAGQPGWAALVPIYNTWILVTEICKKEPLWFFLTFIPFLNIIAAWVITQELAKKFGKSSAFGMGLFFLTPIFMALLAFGDAQYQGGGGKSAKDDENW